MRTIWKFPLEVADKQVIEMPSPAEPLSVQVQDGLPCLWAIVDSDHPPAIRRTIYMRGTGHPMGDDRDPVYLAKSMFLGTIQLRGGALVFHVFHDA